jgi:hypothetical protein
MLKEKRRCRLKTFDLVQKVKRMLPPESRRKCLSFWAEILRK